LEGVVPPSRRSRAGKAETVGGLPSFHVCEVGGRTYVTQRVKYRDRDLHKPFLLLPALLHSPDSHTNYRLIIPTPPKPFNHNNLHNGFHRIVSLPLLGAFANNAEATGDTKTPQ
jgi:hypothetical protein